MNIFLQGAPGAGKSTIIKSLLFELDIRPTGFITLSGKPTENGQSNVYMYEANNPSQVENMENLIGERLGDGKYKAHAETFERFGIGILENVELPLILMDEIGFMENEAFSYQERILGLLEGEIPILGVIKEKTTPFIEKIIKHEKSIIISVNTLNREDAYERALEILKKAINF